MRQLQQKDLNFLKAVQTVQPIKKRNGKKGMLIAFPAVLLVAGLGSWGGLQWQYLTLNSAMEENAITVDNMAGDGQYQQALDAEKTLSALRAKVENARLARQALNSYPALTSGLFDQILECAGDSIRITGYSYSASDGLLVISGEAEGIGDAALFVGKLRVSGIFVSLGYTGYAKDSTGEPPVYLFSASGVLKGREADDSGR